MADMTTRDELVAHTPGRVWLRVCGGGVTMPSGKSYMTLVGDNRPQDRHTEYVRADLASRQEVSVDALAQEIRRVDGNNSLGAAALAEALMPFITKRTTEG